MSPTAIDQAPTTHQISHTSVNTDIKGINICLKICSCRHQTSGKMHKRPCQISYKSAASPMQDDNIT